MDDIIFNGIDLTTEIVEILYDNEDRICKGMTEEELKAYRFGIDTVVSLLKEIIDTNADNEVLVHIKGLNGQEEFTYEDLKEKIIG